MPSLYFSVGGDPAHIPLIVDNISIYFSDFFIHKVIFYLFKPSWTVTGNANLRHLFESILIQYYSHYIIEQRDLSRQK